MISLNYSKIFNKDLLCALLKEKTDEQDSNSSCPNGLSIQGRESEIHTYTKKLKK